MARSEVSVANLALQKLGAERIVSLTQDHPNARSINACFEETVKQELRDRAWGFAIKRVVLAPSSTTTITNPDMPFNNAFPLPNGCLRVLPPSRENLDWQIESIDNVAAIYTNDGTSLPIRYVDYVADPTRWDALFAEVIACRIAVQCCEDITQSNTKQEKVERELKFALARARKTNAFESALVDEPEDVWSSCRRAGALGSRNWLVGG